MSNPQFPNTHPQITSSTALKADVPIKKDRVSSSCALAQSKTVRRVVKVRIGLSGAHVYCECDQWDVVYRDVCLVQTEHGCEYGHVLNDPQIVETPTPKQSFHILRKANSQDLQQLQNNRQMAVKIRQRFQEEIIRAHLPMKLVEVEYAFDRHKLYAYFTAEGRVDFRLLVRRLASIFHIRIELRQIGVRDEAQLLGGIGRCGRKLCCSSHLPSGKNISLDMARVQQLSSHPEKITGVCGRLMCCLSYEYNLYKELMAKIPPLGTTVELAEGEAEIVGFELFEEKVVIKFKNSETLRQVPIHSLRRILS